MKTLVSLIALTFTLSSFAESKHVCLVDENLVVVLETTGESAPAIIEDAGEKIAVIQTVAKVSIHKQGEKMEKKVGMMEEAQAFTGFISKDKSLVLDFSSKDGEGQLTLKKENLSYDITCY